MTKAIIDFSSYPGAALLPAAQNIQSQLVENAALFPELPSAAAPFATLIDVFEQALFKKSSRATSDHIAFEVARTDLEGALGDNGSYVNIVAKGNPMTVSASGYPSYETGKTADTSAPAAPIDVVVRQSVISGSFIARFRPMRRRSLTEGQTCVSDPNVEDNWKVAGLFTGGKATFSGFEPGTTVWVRFRTVGLNNVMGAFSDPAKIMVV
jgi:hypothetical protein